MRGDQDTLHANLLETLGPWADVIQRDPDATIRPAIESGGSRGRRAVAELVAQASDLGDPTREVELGVTLGEGGMGIVRLATQRSMGRRVAVKTARFEARRNQAATLDLLREAWVTGALEHPNIVPVHDVGIDADGAPVIVMRLVDGSDWSGLMRDPEAIATLTGGDDPLDWNLRIFLQVCNAVRFAHSRAIIHRDLKPQNVMIGRFGEVYLLDWGLAVSLEDDGSGRFPLASEVDGTVGTPAYMAPEMLSGDAQALGIPTDVYLLGAVLYEIVEGAPPHRSDTLAGFVASVAESQPAFAASTDDELRQVCARAMAKAPSDRFGDVAALQAAVEDFLRHRGSRRLADDARERLVALEAVVAARPADPDPDADADTAHQLFAECRFGFRVALDRWPDNPEARRGLREALLLMVRHELELGDHRSASLLLAELEGEAPAELLTALAEAQAASAREREEVERLRQFGDDNDSRIGQRTRWFVQCVLGVMWTSIPLVIAGQPELAHPDALSLALVPLGFLALLGPVALWARESLLKTAFNRKVLGSLCLALGGQALLFVGGSIAGLGVEALFPMQFFVWFVSAAAFTIMLDARLWPTAVGYAVGFLATAWTLGNHPAALEVEGMYIMATSHLVLTINALTAWRPKSIMRDPNEVRSG